MRTTARPSPRHPVTLSPCLFLLLLTVGCVTTRKYTFDVSITNATDEPLTLGFIKRGPPRDPMWMSPEDWASVAPSRQPERWGIYLPPGGTMADRIPGEMAPGADPVLRVYAGKHPLMDLLAISHGPDRIDLGLQPGGNNHFIVTNTGPQGGLAARLRHRPLPTTRPTEN